jgi:hypothetical protein
MALAVQYMKCSVDSQKVCKEHNDFCSKCWVTREDGIKPEAPQHENMGQVSWHPGWRQHQLTGRVIAFAVLEGLQQAIQQYSDGTMGKTHFPLVASKVQGLLFVPKLTAVLNVNVAQEDPPSLRTIGM